MPKKITVADVEPLIEKFNGNVAAIGRALGVSRGTIWNRIQESATLKDKLEQSRDVMLDNAESVLYKKVLAGDTASLIFFLKTQGKKRGYVERQEMSGPDGGPVKVEGTYRVAQQIMGDTESLAHASEIIRRLSEGTSDTGNGGD